MGLNRFPGSCGRATDYEVSDGEYYTSNTNATSQPNAFRKDVDARLNTVEDAIDAIEEWPGNSTAFDSVKGYNNSTGSGFDADLLDGHHGSYYEEIQGKDAELDITRSFRHVGNENTTINIAARGGLTCGDFDGLYWSMGTDKSGGYVARVDHLDSFWQTSPLYTSNITYLPSGGLETDYFVQDLQWYNGYYYVLLRSDDDSEAAIVAKCNRADMTTVKEVTLSGVTHVSRMSFANDRFLYIGTTNDPPKLACVYDTSDLNYDTTVVNGTGSEYIRSMWGGGNGIYMGVDVSRSAGGGGDEGCGIISGYYSTDGSFTLKHAWHSTQYRQIRDGGMAGPFVITLLNQTYTGDVNKTFISWQKRNIVHSSKQLTQGSTNSFELPENGYQSIGIVSPTRFVVGSEDADDDILIYDFVLSTDRTEWRCTQIANLSVGWVTCGGIRRVIPGGGGAMVVAHGTGAETFSGFIKDPMLGW